MFAINPPGASVKLASVILDIPTKALGEPYTYLVPADEDVQVGCAVLVPFGHRKAVGFVVALNDSNEPSDKLKAIEAVLTDPSFDEQGAACADFLSKRYVAPLANCIRLFTPPGSTPKVKRTREGQWIVQRPTVRDVSDVWVKRGPEFESFTPKANAHKQIALMSTLEQGEIKVSELRCLYGEVSSTLKTLERKGVVTLEERRLIRSADLGNLGVYGTHAAFSKEDLTPGQSSALAVIERAMDDACGKSVLIDGVTGSGKTEVYLQAIERVLREGKSAIVLVPEISLTPQTVARFRGRFGDIVCVMHSKMSQGERFDQWEMIKQGVFRVVVGARSALFTPVSNLGLIVIDEEHETTYKQESAPRYVSREVASWLAHAHGATLVLGSATPSIDALYKVKTDPAWSYASLPERTNNSPLPKIDIIDMTEQSARGKQTLFSAQLISALKEELAQDHKVVLLLNQRGFARFLLCQECGFVPECKYCATTLTYHERGNKLMCHHCGYTVAAPASCPSCGSPYLAKRGAGTQRIEDELHALLSSDGTPEIAGIAHDDFSDVEIIRMDADTTATKGAHQSLLERFAEAKRSVLLGTQMIAKGLDFDDVTLVGIINADTQLHLPDFRSAERTFDLIEQVAGRAGRGMLDGRVLVQTYEPECIAITAAAQYDREAFLRSELPKRKILGYPPFVRMANILVWGKDERVVSEVAAALHDKLVQVARAASEDVEVLAATPSAIERIRGDWRWHIVIKCPHIFDLPALLFDFEKQRKVDPRVNVAIDIDPADLL